MTHPPLRDLALYAGKDLPILDSWKVRAHSLGCAECQSQIEAFRAASEQLRIQTNELPPGLNWNGLASEMVANIHLGLEAGECVVRTHREPRRFESWRLATLMASLLVVLVTMWWASPGRTLPGKQSAGISVRSVPSAIELNNNGRALRLMHKRSQSAPIFVSAPGTLRARFVDSATDQITINNVYTD